MDLPVTRRPDFQTLESLLSNTSDWRNIQDIIRITFRALADTTRRHEALIQELQSKQEDVYTALTSSLQHKVSEPELLSALTDLERRVSGKTDKLEVLLSEKPALEEVRSLLRPKVNLDELNRMFDLRATETQELANQLSALDEVSQGLIQHTQELGTRLAQAEETLGKKANSDSVASFLRKKVNREDFDTALARKTDLTMLQDLVSALETKADQHWVEQLSDTLTTQVQQLTPKIDFEELTARLKETKTHSEKKLTDLTRTLEVKTNSLNKDLETTKAQVERLGALVEQTKTANDRLSSRKADLRDLDDLAGLLGKKADLDYMSQVVAATRDEVLEHLDAHVSALKTQRDDQLHEEFADSVLLRDSIRNCQAELQRLAIAHQHSEEQNSLNASASSDLRAELHTLRRDIETALRETELQARTHSDLAALMKAGLETKSDLPYVDQELERCQRTLLGSLQSLKEDLRKRLHSIESGLRKQLEDRPSSAELHASILTELRIELQAELRTELQAEIAHRSAEESHLGRALASKAEQSDFDVLSRSIAALREDLSKKASQADLSLQVAVLKAALDEAAQDIAAKANTKDFCTLLDSKANVDDVNATLKEIHEATEQKVSSQEFRECMQAESQILEGLVGRCLEGRWSWTGTELKAGNQVPWEAQVLNTAPDLFVWERAKPTVLVATAGLYELTCAFFSRKRPSIQVQVNGETALSSGPGAAPARKGTGLSVREFLLLPARARLTLLYAGESLGEGFLALRKL